MQQGITGNIHVKLYEIRTVVLEEMSFKDKVYARTDDGQRPITIPHLEPHRRHCVVVLEQDIFILA